MSSREAHTRDFENNLNYFSTAKEAFEFAAVHKDVWAVVFYSAMGDRCCFNRTVHGDWTFMVDGKAVE